MTSQRRRQGLLHKFKPRVSLAGQVAEDLRAAIVEGRIAPNGRVPSEPDLVVQLGVSRATLRHAISILEAEGLVRRRQGEGTFVIERVRGLRNNIHQNFGVTDVIEAAGRQAGTRDLRVTAEWAAPADEEQLSLSPPSKVLRVQRTRLADGRPVAYTIDILPGALAAAHNLSADDLSRLLTNELSLYRLLARFGVAVHHGIVTISPVALDHEVASALELREGSLALLLDQVDYTAEGEPVVLSREYHPKGVFSVHSYRNGPWPQR